MQLLNNFFFFILLTGSIKTPGLLPFFNTIVIQSGHSHSALYFKKDTVNSSRLMTLRYLFYILKVLTTSVRYVLDIC